MNNYIIFLKYFAFFVLTMNMFAQEEIWDMTHGQIFTVGDATIFYGQNSYSNQQITCSEISSNGSITKFKIYIFYTIDKDGIGSGAFPINVLINEKLNLMLPNRTYYASNCRLTFTQFDYFKKTATIFIEDLVNEDPSYLKKGAKITGSFAVDRIKNYELFNTSNGSIELSFYNKTTPIVINSASQYSLPTTETVKYNYPYGGFEFKISNAVLPVGGTANITASITGINPNICRFARCAPRIRKMNKNGQWGWLLPNGSFTLDALGAEVPYPYTLTGQDAISLSFSVKEGSELDSDPSANLADPFGIVYVEEVAPTMDTLKILAVKSKTAGLKANIIKSGGAMVTERGYIYGTTENVTFANAIKAEKVGDGIGEFTIDISGLTPETKYYVKSYAINVVDTVYSTELSFTTSQIFTTIKPNLVFPTNGLSGFGTEAELEWNAISGSASYIIEISKNADMTMPNTKTSNINSIQGLNLEKNTKYYWRVKGSADNEDSQWSDIWSFTTGSSASVSDLIEGETLELSPNPAKENLNLDYKFNSNFLVNIKMYNNIGALVLELNNQSNASVKQINTSELSNGTYQIVFEFNGRTIRKSVVIMK